MEENTAAEWPSGHDVDEMALGIGILNEEELEDLIQVITATQERVGLI